MQTVLCAKQLRKVYGTRGVLYSALNDISLEIDKGEFVGIMGPSGSGKTTLLNIISTIDTPTGGTVTIDNLELSSMNEKQLSEFRRDKLGFIFQDYNLLDALTIKENVVLPLSLAKKSIKHIEDRYTEVAQTLGISDLSHKYPYEVSGGQKQRTAAARAIIASPALILADEPTGALDSKASTELLQAMSDLNEKRSSTIMMVTHDAFAASYCKRILFIKDGRIFTELIRGGQTRKDFFQKILDVLSVMGGRLNDM
jgi:putative ABC transport system ATP-binding protein